MKDKHEEVLKLQDRLKQAQEARERSAKKLASEVGHAAEMHERLDGLKASVEQRGLVWSKASSTQPQPPPR